jgi:hypothetical protein
VRTNAAGKDDEIFFIRDVRVQEKESRGERDGGMASEFSQFGIWKKRDVLFRVDEERGDVESHSSSFR